MPVRFFLNRDYGWGGAEGVSDYFHYYTVKKTKQKKTEFNKKRKAQKMRLKKIDLKKKNGVRNSPPIAVVAV